MPIDTSKAFLRLTTANLDPNAADANVDAMSKGTDPATATDQLAGLRLDLAAFRTELLGRLWIMVGIVCATVTFVEFLP